ncbi:hypothetical protein M413DRAFT_112695 [Hebeloma cylindrosporum]|uniref:Uncharacterized protein n=1 Tax=Hebeloma cylindrosporum TaxID=76867 RepID=A0A0C3CZP0_HEBCY|nr:hypothetical protein M413DRAFT_112695 [Hebeloma cylindrosporum h7]
MDEISQITEKAVIVGLHKIDMNTPADSIEKAAGKIRRAEQRSRGDSATSTALLLATKDLEERIAPLFQRWEEVKKENDELRDRLNTLHGERLAAKEKAKKARIAISDEREESQRLAQKVDTYRTLLKGRDGELDKLKTELEERDKKVYISPIISLSISFD